VFNHTTQADTVNHLSHTVTNTQRLFTAGSDTVALLAGHLALWMSEKTGRVAMFLQLTVTVTEIGNNWKKIIS